MGDREGEEERKTDALIAFAGGWLVGSGIGIVMGNVKLGLALGAGLGVALGLLRMAYWRTDEF